eukprot:COSAG02_NODE_461_length_21848_cov_235.681043_15_plen_80_part_00
MQSRLRASWLVRPVRIQELRRNASELLDDYMKRYSIKTDGFKFDDETYDDSSDESSSPPVKRKRPTDKSEKAASIHVTC